jgi:hypothetical protein
MLVLGEALRKGGYTGKIVFASSDKEGYGTTGKALPDIQAALDTISGQFASTLNYAYHAAK